ncbi:PIN domain-containing protein [Labilibaculum sp. A4]|uniref:PIN domain-containing protein n=1 Tax=Labilibaculum euxinus TaxID=2686357 RepID=UPI000F619E92|nr:PIN domain-containing protein [Labilibaculum euxinus]MDQ1769361.1 PIN domain-containing protein [Labilibaculum euxinus]MWN74887.1 PIN domain-containing protein [Labilibaculum euxinus]
MNKIDITTYQPKSTDKFFFDNNVWMYIFYPMGNYNKLAIDKYSEFLGKVLDVGARIYVCSQILSEFYNSCLRLDFNLWKDEDSSRRKSQFKRDFRPIERCKETSKILAMSIESQIVGASIRIDDSFSKIDIPNIMERVGELDYNDSYFVELCEKNDLTMVSHDRDFLKVKEDITLVTLI